MKNTERGDSLIEVVVSIVIMALLGLTIVGAVLTAKPLSDKFKTKGVAITNLGTAAEQVQLQAFTACSPITPQPYSLSSSATTGVAVDGPTPTITTAALPIGQAPSIVSSTSSATISHQYSATLAAVGGGPGTYLWSVNPKLPSGLSLSTAGVISGTPLMESSKDYRFSTTINGLSASRILHLTIVTVKDFINDSTSTFADSSGWTLCGNSSIAATKNVQQVFVTTTVGNTQLSRIIVKAF